MRGPKLVGYLPAGLRWSGDSSRLYFEWRQTGDDDTSTWVVAREGGQPRKLTDEQRRTAPVNGRWDRAHRRVLFVDRGDIVLLDTIAGTRRQVTRTTGNEANSAMGGANRRSPSRATTTLRFGRPARQRRDRVQLTDVGPKKRDARDTDSQKFIKAEVSQPIEHTRIEAEKKKKTEERDKANALPEFELRRSPVGDGPAVPSDGTHMFILVVERPEAAKRPNVPTTSRNRATPKTSRPALVGDAQIFALPVTNLKWEHW